MRHYPEGQTIQFVCSFADAGVPIDPTNVRFEVDLNDAQTIHEYPGLIDKLGPGSYAIDMLPEGPGVLTYRWVGDGVATADIQVRIRDSRFG